MPGSGDSLGDPVPAPAACSFSPVVLGMLGSDRSVEPVPYNVGVFGRLPFNRVAHRRLGVEPGIPLAASGAEPTLAATRPDRVTTPPKTTNASTMRPPPWDHKVVKRPDNLNQCVIIDGVIIAGFPCLGRCVGPAVSPRRFRDIRGLRRPGGQPAW